MEIFLLETIDNVGRIGERVHVKPGYARNYLIPQGKAALATPENIVRFEAMRAELEAKADAEVAAASGQAQKLEGHVIRIEAQVGAEGKLFGSVGSIDIVNTCEELGVTVERSRVRLPDGPLRVVGEHMIELHLHADVHIPLKVVVASNDPEDAEEAAAAASEPDEVVDAVDATETAAEDVDADPQAADAAADESGEAAGAEEASADAEESAVSEQSDDAETAAAEEESGEEADSA